MKFAKNILLLFSIVFLYNCSSYSNLVVMEEYKNKIDKPLSVSFFVPVFEFIPLNSEDVSDDLGKGDPQKVFFEYFKNQFSNKLFSYSLIKTKPVYFSETKTRVYERNLPVTEGFALKMEIPEDGEIVKIEDFESDIILFFKNIRSKRSSSSFSSNGTGQNINIPNMSLSCNYVMWDNNIGKVMAYGRIHVEDNISFGSSKNSWDSLIFKMVVDIVANSPIKKR